MTTTRKHLLLAPLGIMLLFAVFASQAAASPGAYRVLITETYENMPLKMKAQIAAFPDVATVDTANTNLETPSAATLASYDEVLSIGDSRYLDTTAWGDALADFVDSGGVVVQAAYDNWENDRSFPGGRFASGGYPPFIPGPNPNDETSLGTVLVNGPLMEGVNSLTTSDNTNPALAPGATLLATWTTGNPAVAVKGRVVSVTAFIGDEEAEAWSGDYGRLVVNAVRTLGRKTLTVVNPTPTGGTVTSSAGGISCGSACGATLTNGTPVTLTATANKGFAFAGFSGACSGTACNLTMDASKTVNASFDAFTLAKKLRLKKRKGSALLSVDVGGPGTITLTGPKVKRQTRSAAKAGKVSIPIVAKGKARKSLQASGKAKVKFAVAFTPTGGATTSLSKLAHLRLLPKP
jgi:Divergent InlB B-repeat domain